MPTNKNPTKEKTSQSSASTLKRKNAPVGETKKMKRLRKRLNRRSAEPSESVIVALDNPNGIRWILEFAPIYGLILHGIERGLTAMNKQMQVCSIRSPGEFASLLKSRPPDGFLFLASKNVIDLAEHIGNIPCVSVLGNPCDGFFDRVTYHNPTTGRLPAEIFLKNGITTAAILGPMETGRDTTFGVRHSSFVETMEDAGGTVVSLLNDNLYEPGNPSNQPRSAEISKQVQALKNTRPLPRGLFVMADNLLPAVHAHLLAVGIAPGIDLQVVSCNSESPYFAGLSLEPARVDIPAEEIGFRAVEILEWRTRNPGRQTSTTVFTPSFHIPPGCSLTS